MLTNLRFFVLLQFGLIEKALYMVTFCNRLHIHFINILCQNCTKIHLNYLMYHFNFNTLIVCVSLCYTT